MYTQLILKRASAEGLARMAELSAQDSGYVLRGMQSGTTRRYESEVVQCANELIRRAIDRECEQLSWTATYRGWLGIYPWEVCAEFANSIIALRTWEDSLQ